MAAALCKASQQILQGKTKNKFSENTSLLVLEMQSNISLANT